MFATYSSVFHRKLKFIARLDVYPAFLFYEGGKAVG